MPGDRFAVPHLRRSEALRVALCMIDFNGPAMASEPRYPGGLPGQAIGDVEPGRIRQVGRTGVAD
jgi:hypothetical protein